MEDLLRDAIAALFTDRSTPAAVRRAEKEGLDRDLWKRVAEGGFDLALAPEGSGGSGLALREVSAVLEACGRHAAPIPLGEAMLARGYAGACGIAIPEGVVTAAMARRDGDAVTCSAVPWGKGAEWVLAVAPAGGAFVMPVARARSVPHEGPRPAGECDMTWAVGDAQASFEPEPGADWRAAGAALRTAQIAGALDAVLDLTLRYAGERVQFGRPLAKFQALQQQIAVMAEDVFASRMAASAACDSDTALPSAARAGAGKVVASEAASRASAIAHAVHGAMGIAEEHDLQLFTRRLLAWRMQYGSEGYWAARAGGALLRSKVTAWEFVQDNRQG